MLEYIRDVIKPDIVIWTGDTVPHNAWDHTLAISVDHVRNISETINNYLGVTAEIYPTPGNHDFFPMNQ